MNEALVKLAESLTGTLTDNNEERKKAEQSLLIYSKNPLDYFSNLIQLIVLNHPEISNQLKNSAALAVKRLIKDLTEAQIKLEERTYFASHIFSALISNGLDHALRGTLGIALVPLFTGQSDILSTFLPLLHSAMASECSLFGSLRAIKSIYSGFIMNPVLFSFFKRILPGLIQMVNSSMILFNQALQVSNNMQVLECVEIFYEWSSTVNMIFEYFDITNKESLSEIKGFGELAAVFRELIMIVLPESGVSQASLVNVTPNQIGIKMNQAKTQLVQGINIIVQHLMENKKKIAEKENRDKVLTLAGLDMAESPFLDLVADLLHPIVSSLQVIVNTLDMNSLLELEYVSEIFVELILLVQKACTDNRFSGFFNENYSGILVNVCLPLIKCSESDLETFEESPEEFVSLSSDVCERQESETVKSTAGGLLETICGKIDGSLKFLIEFVQHLIFCVVTSRPVDNSVLFQFQSSEFLKLSDELKVETSLLSLCIVSFLVTKRLDLIKNIEALLSESLNPLFTNGTPLIKNRICMLIHYYAEHIFLEQEEAFKSLVLVILNCCDPNKLKSQSVNFQASETLSHMLQEEEIVVRFYQYLPDIITNLISLIDCQDSKPFFEALQEIITNNTFLLVPHLQLLVPSLVKKVIKEVESKKNKKSKTSIVIVKCWNIIRHLVESKNVDSATVLELEIMFSPLFHYIEDPKMIEFDDDILLFEVALMRRCEIVTEIGWKVFSQLHKVQEKYENTFVQLFQALNCFVHYGKNVLASNTEQIRKLCEMCGKCLFAVYKNKINEATNAEGALIFQQILYTFTGVIDELVPSIIAYAVLKLSSMIRQDFFKARILGIILAAFSYNYELTSKILNGSVLPTGDTYMKFILTEIMSSTQIFKHPYDKKVAVKGLINFFLFANPQDKLVIFQILIEILSTSWKDLINFSIVKGESDMDLKESFKDFNSEELESNLALNTFLNPLGEFDDYGFFREVVKGFEKSDMDWVVRSLNHVQVEKLTKVLQSKRVQIGSTPGQTDVRRVVKPKYCSQNR